MTQLKSKGFFRYLVVAGAFALVPGQAAWAGVSQMGSTLILTGESVPGDDADTFDIFVASNGDVTTFGVVGAADGTTFNGITNIHIDTGLGGNDSVTMTIESSSIAVDIDTGIFGNDKVVIDLTVPAGGPAAPSFTIDTGFRQDNVEFFLTSFADDLTLGLDIVDVFGTETTPKLELEQFGGSAVVNLGGRLGDIKAAGGADFTLNGTLTTEAGKVEVEGNLTSGLVIQSERDGSIEFIVKGNLAGSPQLVAASNVKVEVDGNATGDTFLQSDRFSSNAEYIVKGDLAGSPVVRGSGFSDSLTLQVDGAILSGMPLLDGGGVLPDSCSASPGVTVVNCN